MRENIRKICIPISTRGNYGKLKSTFEAINKDRNLQLQIILAGSILLDSYGDFKEIIKKDGFKVSAEIPFLLKGDSNEILAISSGIAQMEFSRVLARLKPDIVLIIADRFESLAFAQAALCMNCCIAHLEGGEVSGSIDERIRHAITKLSHIHFVSNSESGNRLRLMGEEEKNIIISGNPSIDIINDINLEEKILLENFLKEKEICFNLKDSYLTISQHPVVTEVDSYLDQLKETFEAIKFFDIQKFWILPNIDAGYSKALEFLNYKISEENSQIIVLNSLPLNLYAILIKNTKCLIGNSSSGIRESSYLGVPSINIGNRQFGRLKDKNTRDCSHEKNEIKDAIKYQINHGSYNPSFIYGKGESGKIISNYLSNCDLFLEKTITY
ncbi:UDP-N-acetylglucosamine 2-epimerase (hydrolyzing) [Prochlorococcus marinus str. MU1402]|uniref:UDP-N-acetylglucosamine 2-epimerase n=1 Tax=Prochlorococcus marinus TaxID=1219 RepID=UPI001ADCDD75|nr:UDP-N-acetylglucosamine 2-epimerase [Prochlorococcus marinus]MBO8232379.1 UDP-N-acetylglucosamine 2-epimerase (hydrolyzing) [Prochlorococcus marinus XMU1402]MBW3057107.1 UDP-N-acetylglucosamine 2-epimerase (hydrolyzing) [Prochlorococcus marinus str. MU1402]